MPAQQTVSIGQDHSDYITNLPTTGRQSFPCTVWGLDLLNTEFSQDLVAEVHQKGTDGQITSLPSAGAMKEIHAHAHGVAPEEKPPSSKLKYREQTTDDGDHQHHSGPEKNSTPRSRNETATNLAPTPDESPLPDVMSNTKNSKKPATGPREARAASKLLVAFPSEKKIVPQDIGSVVEKMVPQLSAEVLAEVVASVIAELSKEGRIMEMASTPSSPRLHAPHDALAPKKNPQDANAQPDLTAVALHGFSRHTPDLRRYLTPGYRFSETILPGSARIQEHSVLYVPYDQYCPPGVNLETNLGAQVTCLPEPEDYPPHRADQTPNGKFDTLESHPRGDSDGVSEGAEGNPTCPEPIVTPEGTTEYYIERILRERKKRRKKEYQVRWAGYGPEHDTWEVRSKLVDTKALEEWEAHNNHAGEDRSIE